jgi:hypothetical protein
MNIVRRAFQAKRTRKNSHGHALVLFKKLATKSVVFVSIVLVLFTPLVVLADPLSSDEIKALNEYPNWVADACGGTASDTTGLSAGSGSPTGAAFPNLDPTAMASGIDKFIEKENPNSKLKGLGTTIVASAKNANVNPFLIVAIAHEESNLSDPSDYNVSHGNNSFGREAAPGQPSFQGANSWYRWSSVKASVDYTAPENQNASGGGDMATYLKNQYGNSIDNGDLVSLFLEYAPPSENNTTQYVANVKGWINDMVQDTGSGTNPVAASPSATSCSCTAGSPATLTGNDNKQKIFNYFIGKGLSPEQAAGIDGNFGQESGWNPSSPGGYLAQWGGGRLTALEALAQKEGKPVTDLGVQLDYVWLELTGGSGAGEDDSAVLQHIKGAKTAADAATIFSNEFERPGDPQLQNRIDYANQIFNQYGSAVSGVDSGSPCGGIVNCSGSVAGAAGLSDTRRNVVCLTKQELQAWNSGSMKPGFRQSSQDSFSKYSQGNDELWCADFVSWIYQQAGYPLQPGSDWRISLVQSIQSVGEQNNQFHWHPAGGTYTPKPGDIAIYGGGHVNIVTEVQGNNLTVVGGDQGGGGPIYQHESKVTEYPISGFDGGGITGYVSPD